MRTAVFVFLILLQLSGSAFARSESGCSKIFSRIYWDSRELLYRAGVGDNYLKRFSKSFYLPKEFVKAIYAPITVPVKVYKEFRIHSQRVKSYGTTIKPHEYFVVPVKAGVDNSHYLVASYLITKNWDPSKVSNSEFLAETNDFESKIDSEPYFIVNSFSKENDESNYLEVFNRSQEYQKKNSSVFYTESPTADALFEQIKEHFEKTGKPVYGIEWNTHGSAGKISAFDMGRFMELLAQEKKQIIHPNGSVRFFACNVSCGPKGRDFMETVNDQIFQGRGQVYASDYVISGTLDEWSRLNPAQVAKKYPPIAVMAKIMGY